MTIQATTAWSPEDILVPLALYLRENLLDITPTYTAEESGSEIYETNDGYYIGKYVIKQWEEIPGKGWIIEDYDSWLLVDVEEEFGMPLAEILVKYDDYLSIYQWKEGDFYGYLDGKALDEYKS